MLSIIATWDYSISEMPWDSSISENTWTDVHQRLHMSILYPGYLRFCVSENTYDCSTSESSWDCFTSNTKMNVSASEFIYDGSTSEATWHCSILATPWNALHHSHMGLLCIRDAMGLFYFRKYMDRCTSETTCVYSISGLPGILCFIEYI